MGDELKSHAMKSSSGSGMLLFCEPGVPLLRLRTLETKIAKPWQRFSVLRIWDLG